MTAVSRRSFLLTGGTAAAAAGAVALLPPAARAATAAKSSPMLAGTAPAGAITVLAGQTYTVNATTRVSAVTIETGGVLAAPAGHSLTMTVNGVETGQKLVATSAANTAFVPGTWRGDIVLTVTTEDDVPWQQHTYPFRQAIYAGAAGVVPTYSVLAAVVGGQLGTTSASDVRITSTGECFDGVVVNGGSFALTRPVITLTGNGRCDFVGYGAALLANNAGTRVVVDGAVISNQGTVRTAAICDNGATLVVKNSSLSVRNGVLPADYIPTVDLDKMEDAPWMLGLNGAGNVRATNLLGNNSIAAYLNTSVTTESWGALSTDSGTGCTLVAVNSVVGNTGDSGYGTYVIGNATEYLLGTEFNVGTYATIFTGGTATYGDSDPATVASLNASLGLGLSAAELRALRPRNTVVNSRRFGFMWHGASTLAITGGTVVNSPHATFLNKGQQLGVTVDGSKGARLNPGDGVLVQVIDNDDPGPVMVNGVLENAGVYTQPTGAATKDATFDVTAAHATDSVLSFSDIQLRGDFFNGYRGGPSSAPAGPGPAPATGLNLVLNFASARVAGTITASVATHFVGTITSANWWQLGAVSNAPQAAVNNGVIVSLTGHSTWAVTGPSYLTALSLDATSAVTGPRGGQVTMTVDGTPTAITPGASYTGAIVIEPLSLDDPVHPTVGRMQEIRVHTPA
jgi:hypothetical protein